MPAMASFVIALLPDGAETATRYIGVEKTASMRPRQE